MLSILLSSCSVSNSNGSPSDSGLDTNPQLMSDQAVEPIDSFVKCASTDRFDLFLNTANADFYVEDKKTGTTWQSNITSNTDKGTFKGLAKFKMYSQIFVDTYDKVTGQITTVVSSSGSVNKEGLTIFLLKDGFRAVYNFPVSGITVPMDVTIGNDGLSVSVDPAQIVDKEDVHVVGVSLLPYFGSGSMEDQGYLFIPDGSGAIINFNNGKSAYSRYSSYVYGSDPAYYEDKRPPVVQNIKIPVFGIKKNDNAFLAVISRGDASAGIDAEVSGQVNDQNTAFASFVVHGKENVVIGNTMEGNTQDVIKYDLAHLLCDYCKVDYFFLDKEEADYSGMAKKYKDLLDLEPQQDEVSNPVSLPLYIDLFGGLEKNESFLGLLTDRYKMLTSYEQAANIIETLKDKGVEQIVSTYTNWSSDEANEKYPRISRPAGQLGGTKGITELNVKLKAMGVQLYTSYDPFNVRKDGNGFLRMLNTAKRISGQPTTIFDYKSSTLYKNGQPSYLASPQYIASHIPVYARSLDRIGIEGMLLPDLGNILYTDFRKGRFYSRDAMKDVIVDAIDGLGKNIIFVSPNAYVFDRATAILGAPSTSSNYDLIDYDVPFYQLVLSGDRRYTIPCVNTTGNIVMSKLKALETGSGLYFQFVYNDPVLFMDTRYDRLYGTNSQTWMDDAAAAYHEINDIFAQIGSTTIVSSNRVEDDVYITVFDNGNAIVVNYSDTDSEYFGKIVPARGYLVSGKENRSDAD